MDYDDFRAVLDSSGVDVWTFIDTAIAVAALESGDELKQRRDGIVERLYSANTVLSRSQNRNLDGHYGRDIKASLVKERVSPATPESVGREVNDDVEELDPYAGLFDDEQKKILEIKEHLEDLDQSEDSLVELLQTLADMDITFQALKETDIGRDVNRLRKHSSNEVRGLVKQLVRKWKEIVDEWVKINQPGEQGSSGLMGDGDSPQQKITQNGHHQVPDFAYSPNPHNGSSGSDKNNSEPEHKPKVVPRREAPPKPRTQSVPSSTPQNRHREQKERNFDPDRLASASKRLQESYKEAENAKKQRTIQVMDIHEIPKPKNKNVFLGKNKGGGGPGGSQGRHW